MVTVLRKGKKSRVAMLRRRVATRNGSTPERVFPINPKENAQIRETTVR
jgi:hypothetical protein